MIWGEPWVNLSFALITFLYMPINQIIPGSLAFYIGTIIIWSIQTQLLVMTSHRKARLLRWSFFAVIACINISVGIIWISGTNGGTPAQIRVNFVWEHI